MAPDEKDFVGARTDSAAGHSTGSQRLVCSKGLVTPKLLNKEYNSFQFLVCRSSFRFALDANFDISERISTQAIDVRRRTLRGLEGQVREPLTRRRQRNDCGDSENEGESASQLTFPV